jgi:3-deoxy-D-manno-octulosonate 8-phosphate phosphatase (KDO 8-P phosphatase)
MTLATRCARVRLLCLDVDGVLSPGDITYAQTAGVCATEEKAFFVRDGSGLKLWHAAGRRTAIVTGRRSPLVAVRADETGIHHVIQGCHDKATAVEALLAETGLDAAEACFVGDDVIDVGAMDRVGLAIAVADGCVEARAAAHYITRTAGGRGAVREAIELIMRCQGNWASGRA